MIVAVKERDHLVNFEVATVNGMEGHPRHTHRTREDCRNPHPDYSFLLEALNQFERKQARKRQGHDR